MAQELTPEAFRKMVLENLPKPRLSGKPNEDMIRAGMQAAFSNHFPKALAQALAGKKGLITGNLSENLGLSQTYKLSYGRQVGQFLEHAFIGSKPNTNPMPDFNFSDVLNDVNKTLDRVASSVRAKDAAEIKKEMSKLFNNQYYNDIAENYSKESTTNKGIELKAYLESSATLTAGGFTIEDVDEGGVIRKAIMKLYEKMSTLLLYSIEAGYTKEYTYDTGETKKWRKDEFIIKAADIFHELREDKIISGFLKKQIYVKPLDVDDAPVTAETLKDRTLLAKRSYSVGFDFTQMDSTLVTMAEKISSFYMYDINLWKDDQSRRAFFAAVYEMIPANSRMRVSGGK